MSKLEMLGITGWGKKLKEVAPSVYSEADDKRALERATRKENTPQESLSLRVQEKVRAYLNGNHILSEKLGALAEQIDTRWDAFEKTTRNRLARLVDQNPLIADQAMNRLFSALRRGQAKHRVAGLTAEEAERQIQIFTQKQTAEKARIFGVMAAKTFTGAAAVENISATLFGREQVKTVKKSFGNFMHNTISKIQTRNQEWRQDTRIEEVTRAMKMLRSAADRYNGLLQKHQKTLPSLANLSPVELKPIIPSK